MSGKTLFRAAMLAAVAITFLFPSFGCGGGGGNPPPPNETRSVNSPGNTVEATLGSRSGFTNDLVFRWIGDRTGTDFGVAEITSVTKISGTGDLTALANGRVRLINDKAYDTFVFDFVTIHPSGTGDPDAGKTVTGRATIHIDPEQARVLPLSTVDIAQDGSIVLRAQAQNSRASGWAIYVANAKTRLFVDVPEVTWTTTNGLDIANTGDGRVTVTAKTGFTGTATVTATYPATAEQKQVTVNVIPHPTVGVSAPLEGATVSGNVTVTFVATNATKVTYQLGGGAETDVTGQTSFSFDSKTLPDGPLAITMRASGKLETVSMTRNVTVNNAPAPLKKGHLVLGQKIYTDSDGQNWPNDIGGRFADGTLYAHSSAGLVLMDSTGQVIKRVQPFTAGDVTCILGNRNQLAIPDSDNKRLLVYDSTGNLVKTLTNVGAIFSADYYVNAAGEHKVLTASDLGVWEWSPDDNWSRRIVLSGSFSGASGNGMVICATKGTATTTAVYDYNGTVLHSFSDIGLARGIRYVAGWDILIISARDGPRGNGFYQFTLDNSLIEFNQFGLSGTTSWLRVDRDWVSLAQVWSATGQPGRPFIQGFTIEEIP